MGKHRPIIIRTRAPDLPGDIYVGTNGIEIILHHSRYLIKPSGDSLSIYLAEAPDPQLVVEPRYSNVILIHPGRS